MTNTTNNKIIREIITDSQISRLDDTGYFNIRMDILEREKNFYNISKKFNMTPIEEIMYVILLYVEDMINSAYGSCCHCGPAMFSDPQEKIGKYRVDFEIRFRDIKQKYVIECDGHDFHEKTKEQAKYDKQRERFLVSKGYKVLRFSGSEIYNEHEKITDELFSIFSSELNKELYGEQ